jgi:L-threonylcarbamoyladenylate synthase
MIARVIGRVEVDGSSLKELGAGERAASPGMKYRHYAPNAAITVVGGETGAVVKKINKLYQEATAAGRKPAVIARAENLPQYAGIDAYALGVAGSIESMGGALYEILRRVDADGRTDVFAEAVDANGFGLAIMNRLLRAAGFHYIQV